LNTKLLDPKVQQYIKEQEGKSVTQLALKKNPFPDIEWIAILNQIAAREKAKGKLPTWFTTENIIYPTKLSIEQTSSETAAQYKAKLVSGENLIDLTGGFGIDDYYFSKQVNNVTHCELNNKLSTITSHNFKVLKADNTECIAGDSTETLKSLNKQWEWIYIDPSRRSDVKGKVFLLKDCLPNVPELLDFYFSHSNNIMIKTAPLLDISAGLSELHSVKAIHIVAVNNEVKELLWILEKDFKENPMIEALSITKDITTSFSTEWNTNAEINYALPKKYLYEPNSAVMKSGAFNAVGSRFNLDKLHRHSQLYTSDNLVDFPGRRFIIDTIIPYQKNEIKKYVQGGKMNVTVRNFPIAVTEIQKKWKIKDGGDIFAFFTTNIQNNKIVLLCTKI